MTESFGSSPTNNSLSTSSNSSASSLSHSRQTPISSSFSTLSPGSIYAPINSTLSPGGMTQTQSATSTASSTPTERNGPWAVRHTQVAPQPPPTAQPPTSQVYHPLSTGRPPRSGPPSTSYVSGPFLPNSGPQPSLSEKPLITVPVPHPPRVYEYDFQASRWKTICVKVLPLFNGEGLKMPIEDLNELVRFVGRSS